MSDLGWWIIHGEEILEALRQVENGDAPEMVYMELYANSFQQGEIDASEIKDSEN